jgi:hypothetical protein
LFLEFLIRAIWIDAKLSGKGGFGLTDASHFLQSAALIPLSSVLEPVADAAKEARRAEWDIFYRAYWIGNDAHDTLDLLLAGVCYRFGKLVRLTHFAQLIDRINFADPRAQGDVGGCRPCIVPRVKEIGVIHPVVLGEITDRVKRTDHQVSRNEHSCLDSPGRLKSLRRGRRGGLGLGECSDAKECKSDKDVF